MIFFTLTCLISMVMIIWFKTDAFIEYTQLNRTLCKLLKIIEYKEYKQQQDITISYQQFLRMKHDNFFVRLVTCPICLDVWLSTITCLLFSNIIFIPVMFILSLLIYLITTQLYGH